MDLVWTRAKRGVALSTKPIKWKCNNAEALETSSSIMLSRVVHPWRARRGIAAFPTFLLPSLISDNEPVQEECRAQRWRTDSGRIDPSGRPRYPHALPMFREPRQRSTRKQLEKDRLDPLKSHKPEPPVAGPAFTNESFPDVAGRGGRVGTHGGTLSSFIVKNIALDKTDDSNPREAILRHAKDAEDNPYWVAPAYSTVPSVSGITSCDVALIPGNTERSSTGDHSHPQRTEGSDDESQCRSLVLGEGSDVTTVTDSLLSP
ncbi:unnamed protein product [Ranitomeya imitator]|uniref:Uncharacterized protein n=1 Tax=Ranitomeya imitator TaxID=111125 RepID=A0ABN9L4U7_9NEOB|nr:unnamed protein product [Ranitomeya imitator]